MYKFFKVSGVSMLPSFKPEQILLTKMTKNITEGDAVVLKTKDGEKILKRVLEFRNSKLRIISDNSYYNSRFNNSWFDIKNLIGKVII